MSLRRRILQSSVAVAVCAVVLLGVPLAVAAMLAARQEAERATEAVSQQVQSAVADRVHSGRPVDQDIFADVPAGFAVTVRLPDGTALPLGTPPTGPAFVADHRMAATSITVQQPRSAAYGDMLRAGLVVVLIALVAVLAAVSLGLRQARRLTEPLVDLAHRARRLGSGDTRPHFARYGVEEVDRVAEALERSAERLATMLANERQFATDASHQLRTPLTALSMRLEEILNTDDPEVVREEARIGLGQVERLAATVDHLLTVTRHSRTAGAVPVSLDEVVEQQVEEWQPAFAAHRRRIKVAGRRDMTVCATPGGVSQVLATLLENSLRHGAGTVTLRSRRRGGSAVIEVSDEGPGVPVHLGAKVFERSVSGKSGTGYGLSLARDLAEADGGRLELVEQRPAVFALFLSVPGSPLLCPPGGGGATAVQPVPAAAADVASAVGAASGSPPAAEVGATTGADIPASALRV